MNPDEVTKKQFRRYIKAVLLLIAFFCTFLLIFILGLPEDRGVLNSDFEIITVNRGRETSAAPAEKTITVGEDGLKANAVAPVAPVKNVSGVRFAQTKGN